ncbi:MAG: winged helix-turn-helix transcriptional regulator [Theionarchaea archaeon]|nr:winged helix-turn-helix transcriptional regulator [Theionarchaea archaeon]
MVKVSKMSDDEVLELYRKGLTNRQIADRLGVTQPAVQYRLQNLELMNNFHHCKPADPTQVKILHDMGLTTIGIAQLLRTNAKTILEAMKDLELEDNCHRLKELLRKDNQECECGD